MRTNTPSTRSFKRRRIALLLDNLQYQFQNELWFGVHKQCCKSGVDLYCISGETLETKDDPKSVFVLVGPNDFDGIVMSTGTLSRDEPLEQLEGFLARFGETPIVSISSEIRGVPSVIIDNLAAMRSVTRHLVDVHARRRIAFLRVNSPEGLDRFAGYREALFERGLPLDEALVVDGEFTWDSGVAAIGVLLDERRCEFDAFIGASDWIALGAMHALQQRGLSIPKDVAVFGFDDIENARFAAPPLASVRQPVSELGIAAVEQLCSLLDGNRVDAIRSVTVRLQLRQSCGCGLPTYSGISLPPAAPQDLVTAQANHENRVAWLDAVRRATPRFAARHDDSWIPELVTALEDDCTKPNGDAFLTRLSQLVCDVESFDCVPDWHEVVRALRIACVTTIRKTGQDTFHVESLFERAHLLIASVSERVQGQRRMEHEGILFLLNEVSRELRTLHDDQAVLRTLSTHLPKLGIERFFVVREDGTSSPFGEARLLMTHESGLETGTHQELSFRTGELVPLALRPQPRHTMFVQRVSFSDEAAGYCAAEYGPHNGVVYETIRGLLNAGLQNAGLMRQVVMEVSRRERAERARLESEMLLAQRIQSDILPKVHAVRGLELATVMIPADEVGGDYFDILPTPTGCWLGIGDVAGHGLDTGLIMLMIQSVVSATTKSLKDASPRDVWKVTNQVIYENIRERLRRDEHATLSILKFDECGRLEFAGAHEDLLVYRARTGRCEVLPTGGIWAGICAEVTDDTVDVGKVQLEENDVLLLYTDGIIEAMTPNRELYGLDRLVQQFESVATRPVEAIKAHLIADVTVWSPRVTDDRTLVVARYVGNRCAPTPAR